MERYLRIAFQDPPLPKVRDEDHQGRKRVCLCVKKTIVNSQLEGLFRIDIV